VLVAPGTAFFTDRAEGERWIRVTFARDPGATDEALDRIGRFLSR
jgi:aspartate/methionine/tyrosine aminotransferase